MTDPQHMSQEEEAYLSGFRDAIKAMTNDEVYYNVLNGKPGLLEHVQNVADYLKVNIGIDK